MGSSVLSRLLVIGVGAALWLAACAPAAPSTPAGAAGAPQAQAQATTASAASKPATNRVVISVPPPAAEGNAPGRDYSSPDVFQLRPMYEYLVGIDAQTGKFVPQLATEWRLEPDGKSYRFFLRKGVQFQKGFGEFTAKDVVWSWQDITVPDSLHGQSAYFRDIVESIEVVNDYEVVFHLKRNDADFLNTLSELVGGMEIQSKAAYDKLGHAPSLSEEPIAGTGPYQFKERHQGQNIVFERVPYQHWRITPDFPELEFRWQSEASTRLSALLAGEVHITTLPKDVQAQAPESRGFQRISGNVAGLRTYMTFLCCYHNDVNDPSKGEKYPDSPLADVRVRHALNVAVDRDQINKSFFGGRGETMYINNLHPTLEGWNPEWEKQFPAAYGYDPAKAKQLLADAGYGPNKPLKTSLIISKLVDVPESADVEEAVAGYWRAVGVDVDLVTLDAAQFSERRRNLGFDNAIEIRSTASHPLLGWRVYSSSRHGLRGSAVELWDVDNIFRKIQVELDDQKRAELWRQLGDTAFPEYQHVPLYWLPTDAIINTNVVASYSFPGNISGSWTHTENIKAAKKS